MSARGTYQSALAGTDRKATEACAEYLALLDQMVEKSLAPRYVVPFPGMGQRRRFLDAMARIVPDLRRAGEPH